METLRRAVHALNGDVFAVFDGARFENLPGSLRLSRLTSRCLYLDRGDNHPERLITAPHLVGPLDGEGLGRALALLEAADTAAAVFWECETGGTGLYAHLRRLNRIVVPELGPEQVRSLLPATGMDAPLPSSAGELQTSFLLFRHSDANVVAQMKLGLQPRSLARLLGPARRLVCLASDDWGGLQRIDHPSPGEAAPAGPLRLSPHETLALREARLLRFDQQLEVALRKKCSALEVREDAGARLRAARRRAVYLHGAESEQHILDFVELELVWGEHVARDRDFRRIMGRRGWPMERRCLALRRRFLNEGDAVRP